MTFAHGPRPGYQEGIVLCCSFTNGSLRGHCALVLALGTRGALRSSFRPGGLLWLVTALAQCPDASLHLRWHIPLSPWQLILQCFIMLSAGDAQPAKTYRQTQTEHQNHLHDLSWKNRIMLPTACLWVIYEQQLCWLCKRPYHAVYFSLLSGSQQSMWEELSGEKSHSSLKTCFLRRWHSTLCC